jgi:hypothetical protein
VSLKSLLRNHSLGCQTTGPAGSTGPTPVVALSLVVPLVPGLVLLHVLIPCHVLHLLIVLLLIVLHLLIVLLLVVLLILVQPTQDLDKGKYVNKFISTKYVTSSPCAVLNRSQCLLLLEELPCNRPRPLNNPFTDFFDFGGILHQNKNFH